jgi:hypothetical protein
VATTKQAVLRLASERPDWLPVLQAAARRALSAEPFGGEFAGHWVLRDLGEETGRPAWRPGLRLLVGYGLLLKAGESTRGGRRAYYRMPDREGVEAALAELRSRGLFPARTPEAARPE